MANGNTNVNIQVGFSVDKSGLNEMQSLFQRIANQAQTAGDGLNSGLKKAGQTAQTLDSILEKTFNTDLGTLNVTKFNQELKKNGLTLKDVKNDLSQVGSIGSQAYNRLSQAILGTNLQLKQSSKLLDEMATSMANTVKWGVTSAIFNNIANSIQKAVDYSRKLNTSLNDIRIVTDKSAESMEKFAEKANQGAIALGSSTLDYTQASLIYYQQGLEDAEVQARAETTLKAANVTGQRGEEVSEQLTAVWNGYKVTAAETELYVDKLAAVAASTASDLEELSKGMSKVASAANSMGVDVDQLNAQLATIISVTKQAPENVGTALKTIYARLGDLKADGTDEFGVSLGEVSSQLASMGIQVLDQEGNLRDMGEVIEEVAGKWNSWTEAQRQAAAVAMAGKRQYNNLIALFDNWDMYTSSLETSANAMGTLQKQQDIYMESTAAKLQKLRTTWQGVYQDFIIDDEVNAGIEAITDLVEVLDNFVASFGGGIKTVMGFGAIVANVFNKQIANGINNAINRQQVYQQNLDALNAKAEILNNKSAGEGTGDTAYDQAVKANTDAQIEQAQKIYDLRGALNTEQYNTLTGYQQEIGHLAEIITLTEDRIEKTIQNNNFDEKDQEILKGSVNQINERVEAINVLSQEQKDFVKEQQEELKYLNNNLKTVEQIEEYKNRLLNNEKALGLEVKKRIEFELKNIQITEDEEVNSEQLAKAKAKIIKFLREEIEGNKTTAEEYDRQLKIIENILGLKRQINEADTKSKGLKQQINDTVELAAKNYNLTGSIVGITSALGTMAMTWSSVNSLISTWMDDSVEAEDKVIQTITVVSMALPAYLSTMAKLKEMQETLTAARLASAAAAATEAAASAEVTTKQALEIISGTALEKLGALNAAQIYKEVAAKIAKGKVTDENIKKEIIEETLRKHGIASINEESMALLMQIGVEDAATISTNLLSAAWAKLTALFVANPIGLVVTAIAALVAGLVILNKIQEENLKKEIESAKERIKEINKIQEETKANKELYESYEKTFEKYKEGVASKDEMKIATEKLCEKYDIEIDKLDELAGRYDKYNERIKAAREEELKNAVKETKDEVKQAGIALQDNAKLQNKQNKAFAVKLDQAPQERIAASIFNKYEGITNVETGDASGTFTFQIDDSSPEAAKKSVEGLEKGLEELKELYPEDYLHLEEYKQAKQAYDDLIEDANEYGNAIEELPDFELQLEITSNIKKENIKNVEDYFNIIEELESKDFDGEISTKKIRETLIGTDEELNLLDAQYEAITKIEKAIGTTREKVLEYIKNLPEKERTILFSGQVEIDGIGSFENLTKEIQNIQNRVDQEDLGVVVSLREKVSSDKKLTKNQVKEAAGEKSNLAQDYETELADFDNASQLKQLDILNEITEDKIALNKKYIEDAKETAEEEKKIQEDRKKNLIKELQILQTQKGQASRGNGIWTEENEAALKNLEGELDIIENKITDLQDISENGLAPELVDNMVYQNMIAGIDGVITEAEVLRNLTDDIGENWTIAADKIENFGKNFPEILEDAENYQFLQDGSLQLTEAGQKALKDTLETRKANLKAVNEEYQLELQKQADIQQAAADYYNQQADMLEAYLNGEADAKETEQKMEASLNDYKKQLMEITGQNDQELNATIQENLGLTRINAQSDIDDIYKYWCSVGEAAAAASVAYETGEFNPPGYSGDSGSRGVKVNTRSFEGKDSSEAVNSLERMSSEQIQSLIDDFRAKADEASNKAADYISKKVGAGAAIKAFENSADNAISGKGNGKEKKEKERKDKDEKRLDDEFDRYWDIKKAIDAVDRALNKLAKDQENLYGDELADSLMQTNQLLEQQAANYARLAEEQKKEAAELQNVLGGMGVTFDASGAITNYAAATTAALAEYNEAIAKYNAGLIDESSFKIYEKQYELFKKQLERYDQLFYTEMKETQEKLEEIERQKKANNLKAWQVKLEVKLEMKELKREWNNFLAEINKDFKSVYKDLRVEVETMKKNAKTYGGENGTIMTEIKAIKETEKQIDIMKSGGVSDKYESISQAQEKLKELNQKLLSDAQAFHDLVVQAWQAYLEGIDQVKDQLDEVFARYQKIGDKLSFLNQLSQIVFGDNSIEGLKNSITYYNEAIEVNDELMKSQKAAIDTLQKDFDKLLEKNGLNMVDREKWTEDVKKEYEMILKYEDEYNDKILENAQLNKDRLQANLQLSKQQYLKSVLGENYEVNDKFKELEKVAKGDALNRIVSFAEYQKLKNSMNDLMDDLSSNSYGQNKLLELRNSLQEELNNKLEKQGHLDQYDIDRANLKLQILQKELEIESAKENKNAMKVVRNEEGNWSYQYVTDEDEINNLKNDLLDLEIQLNNLDEKRKETLEEQKRNTAETAAELYETLSLALAAGEITLDDYAKYMEAAKELSTQSLVDISEKWTEANQNAAISSIGLLAEVVKQDKEIVKHASIEEKAIINDIKKYGAATFQDVTALFSGEAEKRGKISQDESAILQQHMKNLVESKESLSDRVTRTIMEDTERIKNADDELTRSMINAVQEYGDEVNTLSKQAGVDIHNISDAMRETGQETDELNGKAEQLASDGVDYIDQLRQAAEELERAWKEVEEAIKRAIEELERYLQIRGSAGSSGTDGLAPTSQSSSSGGATSTTKKTEEKEKSTTKSSEESKETEGWKDWRHLDVEYSHYKMDKNGNFTDQYLGKVSRDVALSYQKRGGKIVGERVYYKTGGYTGTWSGADTEENGKLAMLHQKELVLNADDTKNLLNAVGIVRALGDFISATTAGLSNVSAPGMLSSISNNNSSSTYGDVVINAEFPNATDVEQIKEAILTLPNIAAQYFAKQNTR